MTTDLTIEQFSRLVGVSKPTVWKYIGNGSIGAYRLGRSVRIPREEFDRIREENKVEVNHDIH